jgi:hypothetical protein
LVTTGNNTVSGAGTLDATYGTLSVLGGVTTVNTGSLAGPVAFGSVQVSAGSLNVTTAAQPLAAGSLELIGGALTVTGSLSTNAFTQSGGTLGGGGTLNLLNSGTAHAWSGGTWAGPGRTELNSGGTLVVSGTSAELAGRTVQADGSTSLQGGLLVSAGQINTAGTVSLGPSAHLQVTSAGSVTLDGPLLTNAGTLTAAGGLTRLWADNINNSGTLVADGGVMWIGYRDTYSSTPPPPTAWTNAGVIQATNAGTLYLDGAFQLNDIVATSPVRTSRIVGDSNATVEIWGSLDLGGSGSLRVQPGGDLGPAGLTLLNEGVVANGTLSSENNYPVVSSFGTLQNVTLAPETSGSQLHGDGRPGLAQRRHHPRKR